ncbi:MAG TPA: DUF2167 domain-containing protein [Saprospiraceae bacterium]|nr:DUF2167 domain-containing protein [Saprospiraceae bacterium]
MLPARFVKLIVAVLFSVTSLQAQEDSARMVFFIDSINQSFKFVNSGEVSIAGEVSTLKIPAGYKFLDAPQSRTVLEDLWGNPPDEEIDGMLFPQQHFPLDSNCWAFVISYSTLGYIKDKDADKMNYDKLMKQIQEGTEEENKERIALGYESIEIVGWASPPYYDKLNKALHWAKEIKFGDAEYGNTLNYDMRFLGRKGVLSYNAVGSMDQLVEIRKSVPVLLEASSFTDGNKYADFNPKIDKVAAIGIGGLIAGKLLAKVGLFAVLAKFGKFIIIGLLAFGGAIWRKLSGRKKEREEMENEVEIASPTDENTQPENPFGETEVEKKDDTV